MCYNINMDRNIVNILGYGVDTFSFNQAKEYILNTKGQVITINPEMIECAEKNSEFAKIIKSAQLVVPDGIGIKLGFKILGHNVERIAGIDFGMALIKCFCSNNKKIAFIGSTANVVENAIHNIKNELPNLNVVYYHDGFFDDKSVIYEQVIKSQPDLVLVALGSPKQEFFIFELKDKLPDSVLIGLGGSFDVWAGAVKRAPKIFQNLGIEWLFRLISEPKRIKRIFPAIPLFIFKVIKERLKNK